MKPSLWLPVLLALSLVACGTPGAPSAGDLQGASEAAEQTATAGGGPAPGDTADAGAPEAMRAPAPGDKRGPPEEASSPSQEQGPAEATSRQAARDESSTAPTSGPAESSAAESGPTSTVDPTVQALAREFSLPVLGDDSAPVLIYEFSDYL